MTPIPKVMRENTLSTPMMKSFKHCKHVNVSNINEAIQLLQITPEGNFEGSCIITLASLERPEWFDSFVLEAKKLRSPRIYPFIDRKINVAWNAMMIKSLFILRKANTKLYDASHCITRCPALKLCLSMTYCITQPSFIKHQKSKHF